MVYKKPSVMTHNILVVLNEMLDRFKQANTIQPRAIKDYCLVEKGMRVAYAQISQAAMFLGEEAETKRDGTSRFWYAKRLRRKVRAYLADSPYGPGGVGPLKSDPQNQVETDQKSLLSDAFLPKLALN